MTRIELTIADELASKAQAAGLLEQAQLEELLRAELRRQAAEKLRETMAALHAAAIPEMSMDEINAIVKDVRREMREGDTKRANRR